MAGLGGRMPDARTGQEGAEHGPAPVPSAPSRRMISRAFVYHTRGL